MWWPGVCGCAGLSMGRCCGKCWRRRDDVAAARRADLAGVWRDGYALRLRRVSGVGADTVIGRPVYRSSFCFSRPARQSLEDFVVEWRRDEPVCQATDRRTICVAAERHGHGGVDERGVVDAARGD